MKDLKAKVEEILERPLYDTDGDLREYRTSTSNALYDVFLLELQGILEKAWKNHAKHSTCRCEFFKSEVLALLDSKDSI